MTATETKEVQPFDLAYDDYVWDPSGGFRQKDLTVRQVYDRKYLADRYEAIEENVRRLARRRMQILDAFVPDARYLLDFGCGTGHVVKVAQMTGWAAHGYDIVPRTDLEEYGVSWDQANSVPWQVVTFFDSLEHLPEPDQILRQLSPQWVMISIPECHLPADRDWFMSWKHRRPGEHLWHWNRRTLDQWFWFLGYEPVMHSHFEDEYRPRYHAELPNILTAIYKRQGG